MGETGNCTGKCIDYKGIGRHMDWKINVYCRLCRKIFPIEEVVNAKFCPCCKGWIRRSPTTSSKNAKIKRAEIKMNESKKKTRLSKVSPQKLDKTRNANYEHDFPICESCRDTVEYTDDNGFCEECANEAGIAYEESRNDLD